MRTAHSVRWSCWGLTAVVALAHIGLAQAQPPPLQYSHQATKLVATESLYQGGSVSISADGRTAITSGCVDSGAACAAQVWTRGSDAWALQAKLIGSGAAGDPGYFSVSISADGDTAIVGGSYDNGGVGAAWVFIRSGGVWTQQGNKLVGTGAANYPYPAQQGSSVALSADGNTALVGAPFDASYIDEFGSTGQYAGSRGAGWIWTRSNGVWTQQGSKLAGDVNFDTQLGWSVSLSGDGNTALIGSPYSNGDVGSAKVYVRSGGVWSFTAQLAAGSGATGPYPPFQGYSALSADGNTAIVGGYDDNGGVGAAWVWVRNGNSWSQQGSKLVGSGYVGNALQGTDVSLSGDGNTAIVAGYTDNGNVGAAWVWRRNNGAWTQQGAKIVASDVIGSARFGASVDVSDDGSTALIGGPNDNVNTGAVWAVLLHASPATEFVTNGAFTNGATAWQLYATPDPSYIVSDLADGALEYYRVPAPAGTSNQAVAFQETGVSVDAGAPLVASFSLGNSGAARRRISVLILDGDFSDLSVCTFWLPPHSPLSTYQMKTHTSQAWANASIYFYAATAATDGFYLLDNVSLKYDPTQSNEQTMCVDPTAPAPTGGTASSTLLTNGDFGTGSLAPWGTYGTITSQITGGVFEFIKPTGTAPAGVVLQETLQAMTANEILTANFQLGNSSGVRKRVTVLLHDNDFSDLTACTFWLAPGQALSNYAVRSFSTKAWANTTLSVYPATVGPDQWIQLDNATLQRTPGATILGTECGEPGVAPLAPDMNVQVP